MLSVLRNRTYRHLLGAQVVALTGTGLATVALGLLAYDLAQDAAGLVLGTALTIKMVAYVVIAPLAAAFAERLDRRRMLVALDLVRAAVAVCLPFVTEVWQIYVLIFVLQSASAGFTPAFQATIPDVLTDEQDYTKALSLSRLAYDLESLLSPALAAALLLIVSFDSLFWGTSLGFIASALLVVSVALPSPKPTARRRIYDRTTRGIRLYLQTPRLRGLLALSWTAAALSAMVIVNTVVIVRSDLGLSESAVAIALAGFGGGSMLAAFVLPRLLVRFRDRTVMLTGATFGTLAMCLSAGLFAITQVPLSGLAILWACIGFGYSATLTPSGRLLTRSVRPEDRPAMFAAQFTLSHACWLVLYPLTGWIMTTTSTATTLGWMTLIAAPGVVTALMIWPHPSRKDVSKEHADTS
ncbi:multidrug efflux system protein MdtL [Ruegeria denitrificans]|uniref:Multidrug efflux system protein MdtL n=1 Tax=Ruegeria denitrificans TaxID=1715692 RepID=A0A0N7M9T2_9RHOB|nr:MFS transporter [Ruegeria denitrificans]CUK03026.1 multidrug efflux system protein MdtL [Ruegeria denitrificans]